MRVPSLGARPRLPLMNIRIGIQSLTVKVNRPSRSGECGRVGQRPYMEKKCCRLQQTTSVKNGAHTAHSSDCVEDEEQFVGSIGNPGARNFMGRDPNCLKSLVDLNGFEPLTSSMPFKKYQSLTGVSTRNKRLSNERFGRQWTPRGSFFGRLDSARTPDSTPRTWPLACLHARLQADVNVVCWSRQHFGFRIRRMPAHAPTVGLRPD